MESASLDNNQQTTPLYQAPLTGSISDSLFSPTIPTSIGLIYSKLSLILADAGAIEKGQRNREQGYQYRGIDDLYNELHPLFGKHRVFVAIDVLERVSETFQLGNPPRTWRRVTVKVRYTYTAEDGSSVSDVLYGEGMDNSDKAGNKAMSAAQKYALIQKFLMPTAELDEGDYDHPPAGPDGEAASAPNGSASPSLFEDFDGQVPPYDGDWREYVLERDINGIPKGTLLESLTKGDRRRLAMTFKPQVEKATGIPRKGDLNLRGALDVYARELQQSSKPSNRQ